MSDEQKKPTVELRSDLADHVGKLKGMAENVSVSGGGGFKGVPKWAWIGIGLVVLLIVVVGAWVMMGGGSDDSSDTAQEERDDGFFGNLPLSGNAGRDGRSPYSGRECENSTRRAIGVMLAGDPINRPVSGFAKADMVWELPVLASNVTRLMAVYQCEDAPDIGSVRSVRHDYLFIAEGLDVILGHWGGSYHALNRIDVGEFQTINALSNPFNAYFRKNHLPRPYNGFTTGEGLRTALEGLGYRTESNFEGYEFKDDAPEGERGPAGKLSVGWPGQFRVHYEYDPVTNRYQRYWAGVRQVDGDEDGADIAPSAVVIVRASNGFAEGPGGYNEVGIEGSGALAVYQDGKEIVGTWEKNELEKKDRMKFLDENGKEIALTRGQIWVMTPSDDIVVTWEPETPEPAQETP